MFLNIGKFLKKGTFELKPLWSLTVWDKKFSGVDKAKQKTVLSFKHVSAGKLRSLSRDNGNIKLLATGKFDGYGNEKECSEFINEAEVISFPSGGTASIKYFSGKFVDSGNILCCSSSKQVSLKYIYYFLTEKKKFLEQSYRGSGVKHPEMSKILDLLIPIPSLEVQGEIVRILDNFAELTAELTAELCLRKSQADFYTNYLINIYGDNKVKLSEIVKIRNGKDYKHLESGEIPVYGSGGIMNYVDKCVYDKPTVLIPRKGSLANLYYVDEPFWNVDTIFYTEINNEKCYPKYLFYVLKTMHLEELNQAGGVPSLTQGTLNEIIVSVPNLNDQKKIANFLDNFYKYFDCMNAGLPLEIKLRQKQYEYYRRKIFAYE